MSAFTVPSMWLLAGVVSWGVVYGAVVLVRALVGLL